MKSMFGTGDRQIADLIEELGDPDLLMLKGRPLRELVPRLSRGFGLALVNRLERLARVDRFFWRALTCPTVSRGFAPAGPPHLSHRLWQEQKLIWALRVLLEKPDAFERRQTELFERIEAETAGQPPPPDVQVPRLRARDVSPAEFVSRFVERPEPVVLEGFASDTRAAKLWNAAYFGERFGSEKVVIRMQRVQGANGDLPDEDRVGTIAEVARDVEAGADEGGRRRYVHNMKNIFNWHPELLADLELHRIRPYVGKNRYGGSHLFFGGEKTGTGYHCARSLNFFYMVEGEKAWTLVHPEHTPFMYPILNPYMASVASPIGGITYDAEVFPLYQRVPKYKAHLLPGDVLMNPPWWWHEVHNLSRSSIAVATRWFGDMQVRTSNVMFDALQSTRLWSLWHEITLFAGLRMDALPGDAFLVPRRSY